MATAGSDLSTRMSAEDQNRYNSVKRTAGELFKRYKVEISSAINKSFPIFEILRDRGFITNEKYKESYENFTKRIPVQEAVYDILTELEETFDLPLLSTLFSNAIIKSYPNLNCIHKIFKNGIPNINNFLEIDAENEGQSDNQLSLEQGPGKNSYPNLPWRDPYPLNHNVIAISGSGLSEQLPETEEINAMIDTTTDNIDALESQQANEQRAQQSEPAEISSEDSVEHRNREKAPEPSTSAVKRKPGTVNPENNSTPEKAKKKRKTKKQPDDSVNFEDEILPVTCKGKRGLLIKRKLEQGATRKCIRTEGGNWLTPREFEIRGGNKKANNWRNSLTCGGKPLNFLIKLKYIQAPPITREIKKKVENSDKCVICQDGGKLFGCGTCSKVFHEDCHIPPVGTRRNSWKCTFCKVGDLRSRQHYRESEVLANLMGSEEKLKCAFLLLNVYGPLESDVFLNIPHENYVEDASRCQEKLRKLDKIKESLIKGDYTSVKSFVQAMDEFFTAPRCSNAELSKDDFKKKFKKQFAIQGTNKNSALM